MVPVLFIAESIFTIQGICQFRQPQEVVVRVIYPANARMLAVGRLVRSFEATLIQNRAQDLYAFQDHLVDVLVTVVLRAEGDVSVEYKNIHEPIRNKGNPEQVSEAQRLT